jgi:hypothetical protein
VKLKYSLARRAVVGALLLSLCPTIAFAQGGPTIPDPVDPPEQVAELREKYEDMTPEEVKAAGYVAEPPICVAAPGIGGMGIHAESHTLLDPQFEAAEMDPENPPILLLDAKQEKVIGLEWEAKDVGQGDMELFGVPIKLQQGHPGVPEPHYMLQVYFKPDGKVRMIGQDPPFDPDVMCPAMPDAGAGGLADDDARFPAWPAAGLALLLLGSAGWVVHRSAA